MQYHHLIISLEKNFFYFLSSRLMFPSESLCVTYYNFLNTSLNRMHLSKVTLIILFFELVNSGRNRDEVLNTTTALQDIESTNISKKKIVGTKIFSLKNPLLPDVPDFNVTPIYATTFSPNALAIQGSNSQNFLIRLKEVPWNE